MSTDLEASLGSAHALERLSQRRAGVESAISPELAAEADVVFAIIDSPVGDLVAAATQAGLVRLSFGTDDADEVVAGLARRLSPSIVRDRSRLDPVKRQLDEYFDGRRRTFDLALDWALTAGFTRSVLEATARIPFGSVSTYRQVAGEAGSPAATRAAGNALGSNPIAIIVPCHRVLRTGGGLGGYGGGLPVKERLLRLEGALL